MNLRFMGIDRRRETPSLEAKGRVTQHSQWHKPHVLTGSPTPSEGPSRARPHGGHPLCYTALCSSGRQSLCPPRSLATRTSWKRSSETQAVWASAPKARRHVTDLESDPTQTVEHRIISLAQSKVNHRG